jgi:hypothetical protein
MKTKELKNSGFHDDCLPFLDHIQAYATEENPSSKPYIGHCCILDVQWYEHHNLEDQFHNQPHAGKQAGINGRGCLCYNEFRLLTSISLTDMYDLALGAEDSNSLKPWWSFAVTEEKGAKFS